MPKISVYFFITSVRKLLDISSYPTQLILIDLTGDHDYSFSCCNSQS